MRGAMSIGRGFLVAVAVALGVIAAVAAFFGVAAVTDQLPLFVGAALGALVVVTLGITTLATLGLAPARARAQRIGVPLVTTLAVCFAASVTLFNPLPFTSPGAQPAPGMQYWDLPTGSRLAYVKVPAVGMPKATPIVYLHGGPGAPELRGDTQYFGRLAQDGYDVYLYDQIGAGNSPRLADVTRYTVARHVADLEAVRQQIGADQVILIGQSWGSTLAAAYLVAHGEHVAKTVFSSPGPVWLDEVETQGGANTGDRLTDAQRQRVNDVSSRPRAVFDALLFGTNPRAAHAFASDREMDAFFDAVLDRSKAAAFCDVNHPPDLPTSGTGYYVNRETFADGARVPDPRPALRSVQTPALVLKGGCDYVAWHYAEEYRTLLPNATLVYLPNAGHKAYYDQTEAYFASLHAFLLDNPRRSRHTPAWSRHLTTRVCADVPKRWQVQGEWRARKGSERGDAPRAREERRGSRRRGGEGEWSAAASPCVSSGNTPSIPQRITDTALNFAHLTARKRTPFPACRL